MKLQAILALSCSVLWSAWGAPAPESPGRETLLMNYGWKFHKGELPVNHWGKYAKNGTYGTEPGIGLAYTNDAAWRAIDLPHDFTIEAFASDKGNVGHGYFPAEVGWYRRPFTIPASDKGRRITVEFEGAFQTTTLYCNNFIVGRHESGYAPFQFDITEFINYGGSNVLSVCVDAKLPEGWWYEGGGIYRDVYLVKTAPVHVPWGGVYVQSWFKVDPDSGRSFLEDAPEGPAHLRIQVTAANTGMARTGVKIRTRVLDPEGREVAGGSRRVEVGPGGETATSVEAKLRHPRLWSLEEPQLYTAVVELETEGRVVDRFEQTFGIRTIRFDANLGFFLNGKSLKIRGAANHQDHAGVGIALPDDVFAYRLRRLKEFGFNGYRTAHHPGGPVIRVADRLGMLVLAENRKFSTGEQAMKELRQLVISCRNSPSVIAWNIGNEEVAFQHTPIGGQVARGMRDCVRSLDTTRPVTMGQNEGHEVPGSAATELDLIGFNYTWDTWDKIHKLYPDKPIIETEMARSYTSRGVYEKQELQGRLLSYDEKRNFSGGTFTLAEVKRQTERSWMCGGFIWTGFDYRGEPGPFFPNEWARCKMPGEVPHIVSCHFGAFDLCGFPKDGAYYYKAAYSVEPVVHVFPHWNWKGREGQPIDVWVYSNCDEIDLIVNGRSQGRKPMPKLGYVSWTVPYEAGTIEAVGFRNNAAVVSDKRETTGEPVALALAPDRAELRANHEDVAVVTMQAVDAQGRPVPTATNTIRFRVEGAARLLGSGNGDAATREPDKVPVRSLWAGLAQVLVQALDEPGKAVLIAESDGLKPARLELPIGPAPRRPFLPSPVKADPAMWSDVQGRDKTAAPAPQDDYSFYGKNAVTNPEKAARDERRLFILTGQSNMAGMDPEVSFTPAVEKAFGKGNVIVVKKAWSGCPIRIWYKDWKPAPDWKAKDAGEEKALADKRWFWPDLVKAVTNAIQGLEIKTVTFVWMQGESDAMQRHDKVYEDSLKGVIKQLESDLGRKDIMVVLGRISDFGVARMKSPSWMAIRDIQVKLAESNPRYGWIDTDDLNDGVNAKGQAIKDDLHYSVEGYRILGERFANKAIELIRMNQ